MAGPPSIAGEAGSGSHIASESEQVCRRVVCQWIEHTAPDIGGKACRRLDGQLVDRHMRSAERQRLRHFLPPFLFGLVGAGVDEIDGNPLESLKLLEDFNRMKFVMKDGVIYKNTL